MHQMLSRIDHLIYTASNLEKGISEIEILLGVKPVVGGRHPDYGTHNALLSLGEEVYLEIIAPDPDLPAPKRGRWLESHYRQASGLATWALRSEQIEKIYAKASKHSLGLGPVTSGSREQPDGTVLSWKLTDPYALPCQGALPFLISWGDTPHPAHSIPKGGKLIGFKIQHPDPQHVQTKLETFSLSLKVNKAERVKLTATIETKMGIVTLE